MPALNRIRVLIIAFLGLYCIAYKIIMAMGKSSSAALVPLNTVVSAANINKVKINPRMIKFNFIF